jgi:exopolyphosphatase/guanosine-5'-triphosphate,3'-diphosphate pyrophosphatase
VRITERFFHDDPPTRSQLDAARSEIERQVEMARGELPSLDSGGRVIGLAGSVSTLASLALGLATYDRRLVHHHVLSRTDVRTWLERLAEEDSKAHLDRPGMVEGRQDVIVGGVLVLDSVMTVFDREECLVSESDILDGLAASLMTTPE